jgi:thiamine pyrophosphate-dependent acetolactate synthase large subunit-like protein
MMTAREALEVLAVHRGERIVVTTMSAAGVWPQLSDTARDFAYLPSAMGQGPALGLGLALAGRGPGVVVVNGDGCTLMNLGCLVTLAQNPADIWLIVFDNGHYEVTGGQPTAGTGHADFAALARGAGIPRVYAHFDRATWADGAAEALSGCGPVVIWLRIEGRLGQGTPAPPRPMAEQIDRLRSAIASARPE